MDGGDLASCAMLFEDLTDPVDRGLIERFNVFAIVNGQIGFTIELVTSKSCSLNRG
ncbi:hypothetical protein ES703_105606 [subsurface metagenome]